MLTKKFPAATGENVIYTYDGTGGGNVGIGRLTGATDQAGNSHFIYDALGHVTTEQRVYGAHTFTTNLTYDAAGHVLTSTSPSGRIVTFTRDAVGRVSGIATKQNSGSSTVTVLSGASYMPMGPFAGATFGNGEIQQIGYDLDYQVSTISTGLFAAGVFIQDLAYSYDPAGNITNIADNVTSGRTQSAGYDDLNRVLTASGMYGSQSYTYDGVGNRLSRIVGATTETYAPATSSNRLNTVTAGSNVRSFTYSPSGQTLTDVRAPSNTYAYTLKRDGPVSIAKLNGTTVASYVYNAFENRVQKTIGAVTTDYIYEKYRDMKCIR